MRVRLILLNCGGTACLPVFFSCCEEHGQCPGATCLTRQDWKVCSSCLMVTRFHQSTRTI